MKRTLRNGLSFLLVMVLLLSMFSATAVGFNNWITTINRSGDETERISVEPESRKKRVLYTWTADDLNVDREVFSSNLSDESDPRQRWNESAVMYTQQEGKQVKLHNFLNKVGTDANGAYGLKPGENLKVDLKLDYQESTTGLKAVALSFVYAHKANENDLNPVNSGLLQVYASGDDGLTWSEDYVGVRSAYILGIGTGENDENIIYYQITTENLMSIDGLESVDEIAMLRIMPDGESGMCGGTFALCELTVTGYMTEKSFETDVPAYIGGAVAMDEDAVRQSLVEAAKESSASTSLEKIKDALKSFSDQVPESESAFLSTAVSNTRENTAGIRLVDGIDTKAKDTVRELLSQLLEREREFELEHAGESEGEEKYLTSKKAEQILAEYETIETTEHIVKDLNTPQQIFRAYANAKPGDLLLQVTQDNTAVYMITGSEVEFLPDGVNVKFAEEDASGEWNRNCSTMTYLGATGESTLSFVDLFEQEFVPLTVSNLLTWNLDAYASAVDGVKVAIISDRVVDHCVITVDETTVTKYNFNMAAPICSVPELNELDEGTYTMTVAVTNDLGATRTIEIEFVVEEEPELFSLYNANIKLGDSLTMYFYFKQADIKEDKDYYVTITKTYADGREDVVKTIPEEDWVATTTDDSMPVYRVGFEGVAAKEMADDLKVQVFTTDGKEASNLLTYNIRTYAMGMLRIFPSGKLATLLVDMLNYGAAAQTFFGYNTDDLANAQLTSDQQALATQSVNPVDNRVVYPMYYNVSLELKSSILLQMYFTGVTSDMYAKVSFTDHYGNEKLDTVPFEEFVHVGGSIYYVNVEGLAVADGKQLVTCDIYNGEHELVGKGTDSMESYIATKNNEEPDEIYTQIMKFIDSAYRCFH